MHAQQLQQLQVHQQMTGGFFAGAPGPAGAQHAAAAAAHHAAMGGYGLPPMAHFPAGGFDPQLAAQQLGHAIAAQHASAAAAAAAVVVAAQGGADPAGADALQQQQQQQQFAEAQQPPEGAPHPGAPSGADAPPPA